MRKIILAMGLVCAIVFFINNASLVQAASPTPAPSGASGNNVFGDIVAPVGVADLNAKAGAAGNNIGLLIFVSNMIKLLSVVAGIWVMINFIIAGFTYITASDSGSYSKISEKLSMSVSGLVLIVASYTIAGIISLIVFGSPTYILNPEIPTAIDSKTSGGK